MLSLSTKKLAFLPTIHGAMLFQRETSGTTSYGLLLKQFYLDYWDIPSLKEDNTLKKKKRMLVLKHMLTRFMILVGGSAV